MRIVRTLAELDALLRSSDRPGGVMVPTMGALHEGHAALVRQAAALAQHRGIEAGCVVTIFVNPAQFDESHDYERYPRVLDEDAAACAEAGARTIIAPTVEMVYPDGVEAAGPPVPAVGVGKGLEDEYRPGHFEGVAKVLARLFAMAPPAAAIFGEKDYQQLRLAGDLVRQQRLDIDVVPGPTVRDADGLALSSRNRFLSPEQRRAAGAIPRALRAASEEPTLADAEAAMRRTLAGLDINYATVRDAGTLEPLPGGTRAGEAPARALVTCRLGDTRLLDNAPWPLPSDSPLRCP
ncbi:MAG: pantoate--beta-alanine ligase [Planctomycetota bacterium]